MWYVSWLLSPAGEIVSRVVTSQIVPPSPKSLRRVFEAYQQTNPL